MCLIVKLLIMLKAFLEEEKFISTHDLFLKEIAFTGYELVKATYSRAHSEKMLCTIMFNSSSILFTILSHLRGGSVLKVLKNRFFFIFHFL